MIKKDLCNLNICYIKLINEKGIGFGHVFQLRLLYLKKKKGTNLQVLFTALSYLILCKFQLWLGIGSKRLLSDSLDSFFFFCVFKNDV